jgi:hypothetical protein
VAAARRVTALTLTALLAGTARPADDQAGDRTDDHDDHDREP